MSAGIAIFGLLAGCDGGSCGFAVAGQQRKDPPAEMSDVVAGCGESQDYDLDGPSLAGWADRPVPLRLGPLGPHDGTDEGTSVVARWLTARIYMAPETDSVVIGYARRGNRIPTTTWRTDGEGCPGGMWSKIEGGGYVCTSLDFRLSKGTQVDDDGMIAETWNPLPFHYAKVASQGAPRLRELPSPSEVEQIHAARVGKAGWPSIVESRLTGAYFVAVDKPVSHLDDTYYRTESGGYLADEDVKLLDPPQLTGLHLSATTALPVGFVYGEPAPVLCRCDDRLHHCGTAQKHAGFAVDTVEEVDGHIMVVTDQGTLIPRDRVRVVVPIERPDGVGSEDRWVHIDRDEQTLTAYEGDRPVFTTLVSTGKPGFDTPRGLWRVDRKFVTTTMSGEDDVHDTYTVSEVPWTMFYDGAYALHGTYWHDNFGTTRSHGCTNVAPADARWLFYWGDPLPTGWHGKSGVNGIWIHVGGRGTSD